MSELLKYLNEINNKMFLSNLLCWEMDTITPKKAYDYYVDLSSKIETEAFEMSTSDKYIELLDSFISSKEFSSLEEYKKIYFIDLKDNYEKEKRIPKDFYEEYAKLRNKTKIVWAEAKEKKDYLLFKPYLSRIIAKTKELYSYLYPDSKNIYESMIGDYEKGMSIEEIDSLFNDLKEEIIPIVKKLNNNNNIIILDKKYSDSKLMEISKYLLNYIGFDNDRGALGIFPHGYTTTLNKNDVRIAFGNTRNITDHLCTIIHEGGHGIFEQRASLEYEDLSSISINTIALHESQSRFYENILGRNKNFWIPIFDDVTKILDLDISLDDFMKYLNNAHPSLIRTEADELTYCLHIIIRYEIEKDIFNNNVSVDDLPEIWNKKYKDYLGVNVTNDSEGIMQDVHWSEGSFGYFPSYLLGSIFDGMILEKINNELGDVNTLLKEGRIKDFTKFLNENIHKYGGSYNISDTCKRLCGEEMNVKTLVKYFKDKYDKE